MNKITLTARGREILSENTLQGGEKYWVGYFGLAYVPDQSKFDADQTRLIGDAEHGDYIYNLWQGDLVNEGHSVEERSTAVDNLSKLTLYDRNITSNFRYVYDEENDRNRLVTWISGKSDKSSADSETETYVRDGYRVYNGITLGDSHNTGDIQSESELPCPAPLFYAGGAVTYGNPSDTPAKFVNAVVGGDWPMFDTADGACPMVTPDMRSYGGSWKGGTTDPAWDWIPEAAGKYDTLSSASTRQPVTGTDDAEGLDQYAKFISVSNFNKEHGHVSSEGYGVGYQESCHNMSMVTRLFPIANYELTATTDPSTTDRNISERGSAKAIKYVIRMNLKAAYQGVQAYLDTLTYTKSDTAGVEPEELALYTSRKPNSFKFNRIGIYAVRATIRHFYKEGDAGNRTDCRATHYQMEISPDAKPELFAVMQVDEVGMSEDGSFGLGDFNTTFVLNLENTPENTDLCTNPEVYYNLVENEAITWYQNQLIATAGLSEAVTNLGVNVAYLMNNVGNSGNAVCSVTEVDGTQYASVDHTHGYAKNLVDDNAGKGSVRDIMSANPSMALPALGKAANTWSCGVLSFTMGDNNATLGDYSFNMTANGDIDEDSKHILLMGGQSAGAGEPEYLTVRNSTSSIIMGNTGDFRDVNNSIVMAADGESDNGPMLGSANSLLLGSSNMGSKTKFIDCIINAAGTSLDDTNINTTYPESVKSTLWLGQAQILARLANNHGHQELETYETPLKNVFLMTGDLDIAAAGCEPEYLIGHNEFAHGWYTLIKTSCTSESIRTDARPEDFAQPYNAPMVFTGGIALGGHFVNGYEENAHRSMIDYHDDAGTYGLLKLGTGNNPVTGNFWVTKNHQLYENTKCPNIMVTAGKWRVYKGGEQYYTAGATSDTPDMLQVYSNVIRSRGHWLAHSPHAGKPLIATEMQELDGTLHIGLGQDYMRGNTGGITQVECSYISSAIQVRIQYQNEKSFYLQMTPDGNTSDASSRYVTYNSWYQGEEATSSTGNDAHVFTHDVSGLSFCCKYHYERLPNTWYDLVIDELSIGISTSRPNIHSFYGNASNPNVTFANRVYPTFLMSTCTNISDTNCFVNVGWNMCGAEKDIIRFDAAQVEYGGGTGTDAICTVHINPKIPVEVEPRTLYRFSAVNYRTENAQVLNPDMIPLRMEKIPIHGTYRYLDIPADATIYVPT